MGMAVGAGAAVGTVGTGVAVASGAGTDVTAVAGAVGTGRSLTAGGEKGEAVRSGVGTGLVQAASARIAVRIKKIRINRKVCSPFADLLNRMTVQ